MKDLCEMMQKIDHELNRIWSTMLECMYTGCHTEGTLPGGLNVKRRAFEMHSKLKSDLPYSTSRRMATDHTTIQK